MSGHRLWAISSLMAVVAVSLLGCQGFIWEHENPRKVDLGIAPERDTGRTSVALRDTIGSVAYFQGMGPLRVRGYGLVVGLGKNGSRDCPKHIYNGLVQSMYQQYSFSASEVGVESITPEALIDGIDSAVVAVYAEIPAAAVSGLPIDVVVRALSGTQTKSLVGGRLFPMDLEVFSASEGRRSITGRSLARAAGPVFVNPFSGGDSATKSNPREGMILGGARVTRNRDICLVLIRPSYGLARRIQDRINAHFPSSGRIADATSPSFIKLTIPGEYRRHSGHFLSLVRHLYHTRNPGLDAVRTKKLSQEILHPDAPHADIALCFEGLGRTALPMLTDLYGHTKGFVSFCAGVAGLRLGDHLASDVVAAHAANPASQYRFRAITALCEARGMAGAAAALRDLLNDPDPRVQIAAYEALVLRGDPIIDSIPIGKGNFVLTRVPSSKSNLIYAKRSTTRRIALFGDALHCTPPLFYAAPDNGITINAREDDEMMTVVRRVTSTGRTSPAIPVSYDLASLIKLLGGTAEVDGNDEMLGLGLDYGAVVRALYHLCNDRSINAKFILEQPNVADLLGPSRPVGRKESEL